MIDGILFIREDDRIGVSGKWQKSVSPTDAADWNFVAWNPLNDALQ